MSDSMFRLILLLVAALLFALGMWFRHLRNEQRREDKLWEDYLTEKAKDK